MIFSLPVLEYLP